jgi:hypothetical protein
VTDAPTSAQDSLARRLKSYTDERFPLVPMGIFSGLTVVSVCAAAALALGPGPVRLDLVVAATALAHLLTILLLRVLDEFKDYERDVKAYPERCLSRGVVTLDLLRKVGWLLGLALLGLAAVAGVVPLLAYVAVLVFGLLMAKEFFVGHLLSKDVFVYAALHQPINPLITLWVFLAYAAREVAPGALSLAVVPTTFWWYVLGSFLLGFGFEVARKLWTPAEERPGLVDSYSAHAVGPRGAATIALLLLLGGVGCLVSFAVQVALPVWVHVFFGLCVMLILTSVGRFAAAPFIGASKKLQGAVGLGSLLLHIGLIAGAGAKAGFVWGRP